MAKDPAKLLSYALALIDKDMRHIKRLAKKGKLDPRSSQDLARYSSALLSLTDSIEKRDKEAKSKLSKLSTPELEKLAKKVLQKNEVGE